MNFSFVPALLLCAAATGARAKEMWDMPPVLYSDTAATDPVARLAAAIARGETSLPDGDQREVVRYFLRLLEIREESQILVFSKTSAQNYSISPRTPRALYFNDTAYLGYVLGGGVEIIIHDPALGVVFYFIEPRESGKGHVIERNTSSCLNCHGTRRTESVPGLTVRSVPTDAGGNLLLSLGTTRTDYRSPIPRRWAGYYVTGNSALPHLGNRTFVLAEGVREDSPAPAMRSVREKIDPSRYLRDTSDIVALMVLEHQCLVHNLLTNASMDYRRARWMEDTLGRGAGASRLDKVAREKALALAEVLLFREEAPMGDGGVDGDPAYQESFTARFPRAPDGDSLAHFHLGTRIFKNRCSYMIYSPAFAALPLPVKTAVYQELKVRLAESGGADWIPATERRRIHAILAATIPDFAL